MEQDGNDLPIFKKASTTTEDGLPVLKKKEQTVATPSVQSITPLNQVSPETTTVQAPVETLPNPVSNYQDQNTAFQPNIPLPSDSGNGTSGLTPSTSASSQPPKVDQKYIDQAVRSRLSKSNFLKDPAHVDSFFKSLESYYSPEQIQKAKVANADIIPQVESENNPEYAKQLEEGSTQAKAAEYWDKSRIGKTLNIVPNVAFNTLKNSSQSIADGLKQITDHVGYVPGTEVKKVDEIKNDANLTPEQKVEKVKEVWNGNTTVGNVVNDVANIGAGSAKLGFGILGVTNPTMVAFNLGTEALNELPQTAKAAIASSIIPDSQSRTDEDLADSFDKTVAFPFAAASTIANAMGYKPEEGSTGKAVLEIANIIIPLAIHKANTEVNKTGESIQSLKDMVDVANKMADGTVTQEQAKAYGAIVDQIKTIPLQDVKEGLEAKSSIDKKEAYMQVPNKDILTAKQAGETPESLRTKANAIDDQLKTEQDQAKQQELTVKSQKLNTLADAMDHHDDVVSGKHDVSAEDQARLLELQNKERGVVDDEGKVVKAPEALTDAENNELTALEEKTNPDYQTKAEGSKSLDKGLSAVEEAKVNHVSDMKALSDPGSKDFYDLAESALTDNTILPRVRASVDEAIKAGEITKEEGDAQYKALEERIPIHEKINPKITDHEDKHQTVQLALDLKDKEEDLKHTKQLFPPVHDLTLENKQRAIDNIKAKAQEILDKAREKAKVEKEKNNVTGEGYHGVTGKDIKSNRLYLGDKSVADAFGEGVDNPVTEKYSYSLKNPFIVEKDSDFNLIDKLISDYMKENPGANFHPDITEHVNKELEKQGYDGLIIKAKALETEKGYNDIGGTYGEAQVIVFDRKNVKLISEKPKTTGIAERLHPEHISGEGLSAEDHVKRGRELIKQDNYSKENLRKRFETNKKFVSSEDLDAARAHYTELVKEANVLEGGDEKAFKDAKEKAAEWKKNVVDPMMTVWSEIGRGAQGEEELDTGTFIGLETAYEKRTGNKFNPTQAKEAKELVAKVKELNLKYEELVKKYTEAMDKWAAEEKNTPAEKATRKPSLSAEKAKRKSELKKELMGRFNDVTSMATLLVDKKFYEYSGLLFEEAAGDFKHFAKDISTSFSKVLKEDIPELWRKLGGSEDAIKQHEADIEKLSTQFIDKKDNKFNPDQVKDIWTYAKEEYLDQGKTYQEMVRGVSMDLGLTSEQVQHALAMPKGARSINDQMYLTQRNRRQAITNAKIFVENAEIPKWKRFVPFTKKSIWSDFFFQKAIFGHTGVIMQTHAGMNIFDPTQTKNYFNSFVQQFKNIDKVKYEKAVENFTNDPQYVQFLRAGLDIDPNKSHGEYEIKSLGKVGTIFNEIGEAGNRGYTAVKFFRLKIAKDYYNSLSEVEKADPETTKRIADYFNNSTGAAKVKSNPIVSTLVFAPKLIASRWNKLIIQPVKAIGILSDWKNATPAEKAAVKVTAKRAGIELATMAGLLTLNQVLLKASGSDDDVNITDPEKPDWMRFKWGNTAVDLSGGMIGTAQFVARLLHDIAPWTDQRDLKGKTRKEAIEIALGNYAFNTVSPVVSSVGEPILRHDFNGNTVPWSDEKPLYKTSHKLTWKEYLWQQAPIPAAEAAKDVYKSMEDSGMDIPSIGGILTGIMKGVIAGATGARVMELKAKPKSEE